MIFLNFKLYRETSGANTVKLCRLIKKLNQKLGRTLIIPCLQATDIYRVKQALGLEVWSQHSDPVAFGKYTGWLSPASLKYAGASGTLLSHNERRLALSTIRKTLKLCRQHGLQTIVGTDSLRLLKQVTQLKPDYITLEDSKIIGGPVPMIKAKPEIVKKAVKLARQPFIVGGGIRTQAHVRKCLEFGAKGVLVSSEIALSPDPEATMKDLTLAFAI